MRGVHIGTLDRGRPSPHQREEGIPLLADLPRDVAVKGTGFGRRPAIGGIPRHPAWFLVPLWLAILACGGNAAKPTQVWPTSPPISPTAPISLPPTWTPIVTPSERPADIPGWKVVATGRIELPVPDTFQVWDPVQDRQAMIGAMRNVGGEYSGMAHRFEVQPSSWVLWAWDQEADPSGIYADVNVYRVESPDTATLEAFMEKEAKGLPSFGASVDRQVVTVGTREAGRMIEEYKNSQGEVETKSMVYVLQEGTTFWEVAYACGAADFEVWLPVFDYSFSLFTLLPEPAS